MSSEELCKTLYNVVWCRFFNKCIMQPLSWLWVGEVVKRTQSLKYFYVCAYLFFTTMPNFYRVCRDLQVTWPLPVSSTCFPVHCRIYCEAWFQSYAFHLWRAAVKIFPVMCGFYWCKLQKENKKSSIRSIKYWPPLLHQIATVPLCILTPTNLHLPLIW